VLCSLLLSKVGVAEAAKIWTIDVIERAAPLISLPGRKMPAAALR